MLLDISSWPLCMVEFVKNWLSNLPFLNWCIQGSSGGGEGFEVTKYGHGRVALIGFPRFFLFYTFTIVISLRTVEKRYLNLTWKETPVLMLWTKLVHKKFWTYMIRSCGYSSPNLIDFLVFSSFLLIINKSFVCLILVKGYTNLLCIIPILLEVIFLEGNSYETIYYLLLLCFKKLMCCQILLELSCRFCYALYLLLIKQSWSIHL